MLDNCYARNRKREGWRRMRAIGTWMLCAGNCRRGWLWALIGRLTSLPVLSYTAYPLKTESVSFFLLSSSSGHADKFGTVCIYRPFLNLFVDAFSFSLFPLSSSFLSRLHLCLLTLNRVLHLIE